MKKKITLVAVSLLLKLSSAHAADAIVIVLEAPLMSEPSLHSKTLQTIRKGQRVYVPAEYTREGNLPEFIPTFDRVGNRAYVPSKFIKVVTNDYTESEQPITLAGHDPTDYRLEEPIPETYPFNNASFLRASVSLFVANNTQTSYAFNPSFSEQELKNEVGGRVLVTRKVTFDNFDRIYFGFLGTISANKNSTLYKTDAQSSENRTQYRFGPLLTYDTYKGPNARILIGTGFTYNLHKSLVSFKSATESEDRVFSGYSLSPVLNSTFQMKTMVPKTDFIIGADVSLYLPHSLKAETKAEVPTLWSESDTIKSSMTVQASLFFGLQANY